MANSLNYKLKEENNTTISDRNIPHVILDENLSKSLFKDEIVDYETFNDVIEPNPNSFVLTKKVKFEYDVIQEERIGKKYYWVNKWK